MCKEYKSLENFHHDYSQLDSRKVSCKACETQLTVALTRKKREQGICTACYCRPVTWGTRCNYCRTKDRLRSGWHILDGRMIRPPRRLAQNLGGWFYILQCFVPAVIKIGYTAVDVESRRQWASQQWGSPLVTVHVEWMREPHWMELYCREIFFDRRVWRLDWFAESCLDELVNLVKSTYLGNLHGASGGWRIGIPPSRSDGYAFSIHPTAVTRLTGKEEWGDNATR